MTLVLVVDDSRFMRVAIQNILEQNGYRVETAKNGEVAVEKVAVHNPDVITMDVHIPVMSGLEAVEEIMNQNPTPILMVSAHTVRGADDTLDALKCGAVEFITKPGGDEVAMDISDLESELLETIDTIKDIDTDSLMSDYDTESVENEWIESVPPPSETLSFTRRTGDPATIVIGASTGGPRVVEQVMSNLPRSLNARVIVVQHMPEGFTSRFATRLDDASEYSVKEGGNDMSVGPGECVVAPGNKNLVVTGDVSEHILIQCRDSTGLTPSIDTTLTSVAHFTAGPQLAVTLTGMGDDGAKGATQIKESGGHVIAQDEETSTVYGIPKQVRETGCVDKVLPHTEIVSGIADILKTH